MLYLLVVVVCVDPFSLGVDDLALGVVGQRVGARAAAARDHAVVLAHAEDQHGEPDQVLPVEVLPQHRQ